MLWTLNKATDDMLETLEKVKEHGIYHIDGKEILVKDMTVINMSEDKEFFIFTLSITLLVPIISRASLRGDEKPKGVIIKNIKYRKEREKLIADWNDDDD